MDSHLVADGIDGRLHHEGDLFARERRVLAGRDWAGDHVGATVSDVPIQCSKLFDIYRIIYRERRRHHDADTSPLELVGRH